MTRAVCMLAVLLAAAVPAAGAAATARLGTDAAVRMDGDDACLQFVLFGPGGPYLETLNGTATRVASDLSVNYSFVQPPRYKVAIAAGRATLRAQGASASFAQSVTAHALVRNYSPGFVLRLKASAFKGLKWTADGKPFGFPDAPERTAIGGADGKSFAFEFPGGRKWTIGFQKPVKCEAVDLRRQNRDEFSLRFTLPVRLNLAVGQGCDASCALTASDGGVQVGARDFHGIGPGANWVKLDVAAGTRPSSALDFSRLLGRRGPAGADGPLVVTTNGEFRCARRASEPRRLFGCRVSHGNLFAAKPANAEYVKSLERGGYNAMRITRFGDRLLSEGAKGLQCDTALATQIDQLVTVAGREGVSAVVDVVGARRWKWGELGVPAPRPGDPSSDLAAMLFLCNDTAFESWKRFATAVYGRKNVVGRRNYSVDPAVPLVLALADVCPFSAWGDLRTLPFMRDLYGAWLAEKRKANPDFMSGSVCEPADLAIMPLHERRAASIRLFLAEREVEGLARMKAHLASLGSKALVGAPLGAHGYRDVSALRATAGDFACDSLHIDSPRLLGMGIYRLANANPLTAVSPVPEPVAWHERPDGAMCITSWSHPGPSSWRAVSGLLVGAWAAKHRWNALFRESEPGTSPVVAATERAVFALFARGDMAPDAPDDAFVIEKGALTVKTPRTVGGFSPEANGRIVAQPLAVTLKGARAAVWVTSLSDDPVVTSKRLLLTHLTEMQTSGTLFADSHCDLLMRGGQGPVLVRHGSASVELAVEKPSTFKVFALGTDGMRVARIPVEVKNGVLTFTADVRGSKNAQYLYEITRE